MIYITSVYIHTEMHIPILTHTHARAVQIICNIIIPQVICPLKNYKKFKRYLFLSAKGTFDKCVFRIDLKFQDPTYSFLIYAGNLFNKVEAASLNVQSQYDSSRNTVTCNSIWPDDLSFRDEFLMDTSSHRYSGAIHSEQLDTLWKQTYMCLQCWINH